MATKVEQTSSIESRAQTTVTSSMPSSSSSPKVSMFGMKSGFVIPKNKLSGSLVPIFRRGGKLENRDASEEESNKQVQRKTKWGADLTLDASVRRGRALAYQTRVEQITQQLKSGVLDKQEDVGPELVNQFSSHESSSNQTDDQLEKLEMLEVERRDAIGEILKLNPSYKAPPDYKPLLKEAKVPVPLKLDSGKNFIGLALGPGSNTQKRLEEETGAKIRIHGTKAGTGEKGEIIVSDGNEAQISYEELYVHISADTFEKVDAAVALIELLVTPVSGNPAVSTEQTSAAENNLNSLNQMQDMTTVDAGANQGLVQLTGVPAQPGAPQMLGQPYPGPWLPIGQPHTQMRPPIGFIPPPNSPMPNNAQFHPVPYNPISRPSFLPGQAPSAPGFNLIPRNTSVVVPRPQPPLQGLQLPYMPDAPPSQVPPLRNNPLPGVQPPVAYPSSIPGQRNTAPYQVTGSQLTGLAQVSQPPLYTNPQPIENAPLQPLTPTANLSHVPQGPIMVPRPSPAVLPQKPNPVVAQPLAPPSNVPTTITSGPTPGAISPANFSSLPSASHLPDSLSNRSMISPSFAAVPSPNRPVQHVPTIFPVPASSSAPGMMQAPSPVAARAPGPPLAFPQVPPASLAQSAMSASAPVLQQVPSASPQPQSGMPVASASPSAIQTSVSGGLPVFMKPMIPSMTTPTSIPPVTAPKPQYPSSVDFTFQPRGAHLPVSPAAPRPSYQHMHPPVSPQTPSYQSAAHDSTPKPGIHGFPNSQSPNQIAQNQAVIFAPSSGSFAPLGGTSSISQPPQRHPVFPNPNPAMPMPPVPRMGPPQGFMQVPQMPGMLPPRPENPAQTPLAPTIRPGNVLVPNLQYNANPAFASGTIPSSHGGNQVYDPFSPTSIGSAPQQGDNPQNVRKQDNDPEYEDLMASVGVR